jgi:hypothetical protein
MNSFRLSSAFAGIVFLALGSGPAFAQKQSAAPLQGAGAGHVIVFNASRSKVLYSSRYKGEAAVSNELAAGDYHLFRKGRSLTLRFGSPEQEASISPGSLYQFRDDQQNPGKLVLVQLVVRSAEETAAETRLRADLEKEVRQLKERLSILQKEADPIRPKEVKTSRAKSAKLSIQTWPAGAAVYLTDLSSRRPWTRTWLGTTPLQYTVPEGPYQVLLAPPPTKGQAGRWIAPAGQARTLGVGGKSAACIEIDVTVQKGNPALVRALWLTPGGSMVDRLEKATRGSTELVPAISTQEFRRFAVRTLARARVALSKEDGERLAVVFRRVGGWLRYELDDRSAIDFEYVSGSKDPFRAKVVRLAR